MRIDLGIAAASGQEAPDDAARPGSKRMFRLGVYLALASLDCVSLIVAFVTANLLRFGEPWSGAGTNAFVVLLPIYLCIAFDRGLYSSSFFASWRRSAKAAVQVLAGSIVAVLMIAFYLHAASEISRLALSIGGVLAAILLAASRWLLHRHAMRIAGGEPITTLIITDGVEMATGDAATIVDVGWMDIVPTVSDPTMLDRFGSLAKRAERIIVACPIDRRPLWAAMLKGANVQGEVVAPELAELGMLRVSGFLGQPTLVVSLGPLDMRNRILKRGFDLAVATALVALSWPLLLAVAVAIRFDSAGPVLFRQVRMGRGNRLFEMYKFRSMYIEQCDRDGHRSTERGDARITRIGRLIRATSIDELPQLFNVLRGEMSIVGPRPHALGSLAGEQLFWEVDGRYWDRHAMKPGITGLAQTTGHRGATAQAADLEGRLAADRAYMQNWTIWRDVGLLFATVRVLVHRNAF